MLLPITGLLTRFRDHFPQLDGPTNVRQDSCGICGSHDSALLAKADYWDLAAVDLVRCRSCGLIQVDPMLTGPDAADGCLALYRHQHEGETDESRRRGLYRAFRHGVAFGANLRLKGITPQRVLEVGSGDGYFLKGLQYVFPGATFVCLDLVKEILEALKSEHHFETIHGALEEVDASKLGQFDLIIARDILEHVSQPGAVLATLATMIGPKGYFFFNSQRLARCMANVFSVEDGPSSQRAPNQSR